MKRSLLLFILVFFTEHHSFSQSQGRQVIDSLLIELPKAKEDTNKVILLYNLSYNYWSINPNECSKYAKQALSLAEKLNWKQGIGEAYGKIGLSYDVQSNYPAAIEYYLKALQVFEEMHDKKRTAYYLFYVGLIHMFEADYIKAAEYNSKSLKLYEELNDKPGLALTLANLASIYFQQSDYPKSKAYFLRALTLWKELKDKFNTAVCLDGLGVGYFYQRNYPLALEHFNQAENLCKEIGNKSGTAGELAHIGRTYVAIAEEATKKPDPDSREKSLQLAKIYTDSAITIQKEISDRSALSNSYYQLSRIDSLQGNIPEAYHHYILFKGLSDSVFSLEKNKKLTQTVMQYEFDKKESAAKAEQERKDALAEAELIRQRNLRNSAVAGIAGLFLFTLVIFRQRNKVKKEKKRSDELLLNILPVETAEELKNTGTAIAKDFEQVTVLFTDFKNFTNMSEVLSAQELVSEIDFCYCAFDHIIGRHGIEKIKTIGDSYMCAGGLPVPNKTNAFDTVAAALEIRDFMLSEKQKREAEGKPFFEIRIGCNTGPVVAGIVGIKKFAYDIWGDTVNIASRMESSGEAGKVNISGSTYELVKDQFNCTHRGKIQAKNKGEIDMYFVEGLIG